jgi:hypothetical protein
MDVLGHLLRRAGFGASGNDVKYQDRFRAVYARVIDNWLGGDSVAILGGNFRSSGLAFV